MNEYNFLLSPHIFIAYLILRGVARTVWIADYECYASEMYEWLNWYCAVQRAKCKILNAIISLVELR